MNMTTNHDTPFTKVSNGLTRTKRFIWDNKSKIVIGLGSMATVAAGYFGNPDAVIRIGMFSLGVLAASATKNQSFGNTLTCIVGASGLAIFFSTVYAGIVGNPQGLKNRVQETAINKIIYGDSDVASEEDNMNDWVRSWGKPIRAEVTASLACPRRPDLVVIGLDKDQPLQAYQLQTDSQGRTTWVKKEGGLTPRQFEECHPK